MVFKGYATHNAAMDMCKKLNATLPIPKDAGEASIIRKLTPNPQFGGSHTPIWLGIRDLTKGGDSKNWKDVEGYPIGSPSASKTYIN